MGTLQSSKQPRPYLKWKCQLPVFPQRKLAACSRDRWSEQKKRPSYGSTETVHGADSKKRPEKLWEVGRMKTSSRERSNEIKSVISQGLIICQLLECRSLFIRLHQMSWQNAKSATKRNSTSNYTPFTDRILKQFPSSCRQSSKHHNIKANVIFKRQNTTKSMGKQWLCIDFAFWIIRTKCMQNTNGLNICWIALRKIVYRNPGSNRSGWVTRSKLQPQ